MAPQQHAIAGAFPETFNFYHLGEVRLEPGQESPLRDELGQEDFQAIAFSLQGDVRGALVVEFDRELDESTYTELGNVLASQVATRLSTDGKLVMISPPSPLSPQQRELLQRSRFTTVERIYTHVWRENLIPVKTTLFFASEERQPEETSNHV